MSRSGGTSTPRVLKTSNGKAVVHVGDCLEVLRQLTEDTVDTVLTSPPYWGTRDYGIEHQFGAEEEPALYVERLVKLFEEIRRLLKMRGTVWLNIGDVYFRGPKYSENSEQRYRQAWNRNKQLSLLPFRVAIALQDSGWIVRNCLVWSKPNAIPASVTDRLANRWEPVFLLAKDEEYFFDLDRIRVRPKTSDAVELARLARLDAANGKAMGKLELRRWLNSPRHRIHIDGHKDVERRPNAPDPWELAAYLKESAGRRELHVRDVARALRLPYERVRHYFRPDKIGSRLPPPKIWGQLKVLLKLDNTYDEAMRVEIGDNRIRNHPKGKNPGDVLSVSVEPFDREHFATMPKALAQTLLMATLPPGGLCLDPFCGAGTTGVATLSLGGRFIGIDVVREYCAMAIARFEDCRPLRRREVTRVQGELFELTP